MISFILNSINNITSIAIYTAKQTIEKFKKCFYSIVVSNDRLIQLGIPTTVNLTHAQIDEILNSPLHKPLYYKLLKGESNGFMDTPTEYYRSSFPERVRMMVKYIKTFCLNIFILVLMFVFDNYRGYYNSSFLSTFFIPTFIFALFFFDFATGLTHLTLDNPITKFHPIQTVRNAAWQFQDHHDNPTDTTQPPLIVVLLNKGSVMSTILMHFLFIDLFFSQNLSILSIIMFFLNFLADWNHRVIHTNLTPKHYFHNLTMWLMKRGILMCPKKHYEHHQTYDVNFCTLTGWTDSLLNKLNKVFIAKNSRYCVLYLIIYIYMIIPLFYTTLVKIIS
jgi:hypothetical protein